MKKFLFALVFAGAAMAQVPDIAFDGNVNFLKMPEHIYMGEAAGVATNSKGNILVYTRTGTANATMGDSRVFSHGGSRLFEFDSNGKYLREIGGGVYAMLFAQGVRVDAKDNIWIVDRGASMLVEFDPEGRVIMTMGRKPEAEPTPGRGAGPGPGGAPGRGAPEGAVPGRRPRRTSGWRRRLWWWTRRTRCRHSGRRF